MTGSRVDPPLFWPLNPGPHTKLHLSSVNVLFAFNLPRSFLCSAQTRLPRVALICNTSGVSNQNRTSPTAGFSPSPVVYCWARSFRDVSWNEKNASLQHHRRIQLQTHFSELHRKLIQRANAPHAAAPAAPKMAVTEPVLGLGVVAQSHPSNGLLHPAELSRAYSGLQSKNRDGVREGESQQGTNWRLSILPNLSTSFL